MQQISSIKKISYFVLSIILLVSSQLFLKDMSYQIPSIKRLIFSVIILVFFWIGITFIKYEGIPKIGLLIILFFGIASAVLKPVQIGLDEEAHLTNTLVVRQSGLIKYENYSTNEYDTIFKHDFFRNKGEFLKSGSFYKENHKQDKHSGKIISINNPAYIPSALGWYLGELVSKKIYVSYYLGRIFNVIAYAVLILLAYKICLQSRRIIFLITSFPSYLYFVSGYHYDSIYYGISAIVFALIYKYFVTKDSLSKRDLSIYLFSCLMFTFVKFPFILLGGLIFIIPSERFNTLKNKIIWSILALIQIIISILYYISFNAAKNLDNVDVPSIGFFIKHPLPIIRTFLDIPSVFEFNIRYTQIFAKAYSSTAMIISEIVFIIAVLALAVRLDIKFPRKFKYIFAVFTVVVSLAIIYAITSDPRVYKMGMTYVPGVQGRYFFFFAFFIPIYLSSFSKKLFGLNLSKSGIKTQNGFLDLFMFKSLIFINVLNLGITMYTMIPY